MPSALSSFFCWSWVDTEREPVLTGAALGDQLREDLLRALEAAVLHQLLGVDAATVEVVLRFLPVLVEAGEQVFEADRDGAALVVLDLHRGAVEAEQLPHLLRPSAPRGRRRAAPSARPKASPRGMTMIALPGTPFGKALTGAMMAAPPGDLEAGQD